MFFLLMMLTFSGDEASSFIVRKRRRRRLREPPPKRCIVSGRHVVLFIELNEGVQLCMGCKSLRYVSSPCFSLARFLVYDLLYHFFSVLSAARLNVNTFIIF